MTIKQQLKDLKSTFQDLNTSLDQLSFQPPVRHVYNPLSYAKASATQYLERFIAGPADRTLLLGMNPGPWGMAQTGVPFGEIASVKDWMGISAQVKKPANEHPKRPILGFDCTRSEVSGRRLWGLFAERFGSPEEFSKHFVVFNYCPLIFLEETGRNRTPDKLLKTERQALFDICDRCLVAVLNILGIQRALGVGKFAEKCLNRVRPQTPGVKSVDSILHPSPASPAANRGWSEAVLPKLELYIPS